MPAPSLNPLKKLLLKVDNEEESYVVRTKQLEWLPIQESTKAIVTDLRSVQEKRQDLLSLRRFTQARHIHVSSCSSTTDLKSLYVVEQESPCICCLLGTSRTLSWHIYPDVLKGVNVSAIFRIAKAIQFPCPFFPIFDVCRKVLVVEYDDGTPMGHIKQPLCCQNSLSAFRPLLSIYHAVDEINPVAHLVGPFCCYGGLCSTEFRLLDSTGSRTLGSGSGKEGSDLVSYLSYPADGDDRLKAIYLSLALAAEYYYFNKSSFIVMPQGDMCGCGLNCCTITCCFMEIDVSFHLRDLIGLRK